MIVTQFIFTGKTLIRLADALKEAGVDNFDIATVDAAPHFEKEKLLRNMLGENNLYVGSEEWHRFHEEHEKLGGISKTKEYSPVPRRMNDVIAKEGRELTLEKWREIFGIEEGDSIKLILQKTQDPERDKEYERKTHIPLSPEETHEIQRNINSAREDVTLLANRIIEKIWGEKKEE